MYSRDCFILSIFHKKLYSQRVLLHPFKLPRGALLLQVTIQLEEG